MFASMVTSSVSFYPYIPLDFTLVQPYLLGEMAVEEKIPLNSCQDIAHFLARIYREFKAFYHIRQVDGDAIITLTDNGLYFCLDGNYIRVISMAFSSVDSMVSRLMGPVLAASGNKKDDLEALFRYYRFPWLEEPEAIRDLCLLLMPHRSSDMLMELVSDAQLWVVFTKMLCALIAHHSGAPNVPKFSPDMFLSCKPGVDALSWYLRESGVPEEWRNTLVPEHHMY